MLAVAIPDTVLEEHDSLRDKTMKIGQIARTCSVFGVDLIQVFRDPRGRGESHLIRHVLEYLETPQYLRRRLFPLEDSLRFAGLLPPLRIPSHKPKVPIGRIKTGELREGVVLSDGRSVDVGLDVNVSLRQNIGGNRRVTVRITSVSPLMGVVVDRSETGTEYWGYKVEDVASLDQVVGDRRFGLKVATSRMGEPLSTSLQPLLDDFLKARSVLMVFGSPSRGLFEMTKNLEQKVKFVVNLYPQQSTVTVRTEEALASGLYLLELLSVLRNTKV